MAVLKSGCLQETHCRQIANGSRAEKIVQVVLVVGLTGISDFGNRSGPGVRRIGSRRVIVKERVMRNVVVGGDAVDRFGTARTTGGAVGVYGGQVEAAHERSPGYA